MDKMKLKLRASCVAAGVIALFWAIWALITNSSPTISGINLTPNSILEFPFEVSRLFDALIGPLWILMFFSVFKKAREDKKLTEELVMAMAIGIFAGLIVSLSFSPSLAGSFFIGLILALFSRLFKGQKEALMIGLTFGLSTYLVQGLAFGFVFGLAGMIVFGLVFSITASLIWAERE